MTERVGRYQLLEPIGVGPCGTVSRAKVFGVAGFERQFAIKRFHIELTATTALAQALSAAARAYGSLEHPRIARMSEFGVAQGTTFIAVEYITGLDTMRLIAEVRAQDATLPAGGALALISQAARAVGYAHGRGLSHLGLSPTNVIINAEGDIKLTDFGILSATLPARPVDMPRLSSRLAYLAPEQLANEGTSAATDVFALGVLAYQLVTGQRTFRGDTPQQIAQAVMSGPPAEPPLPRPIVRVLQRCLARSPFERFPDARALADALDAAIRVAPVPGTRKDIGAIVKTTLDRIAAQNEGMLSGLLPLDIGTAVPGLGQRPDAVREIVPVAVLGREAPGDASTTEFVRKDTPAAPPALVSPDGAGVPAGPAALLARAANALPPGPAVTGTPATTVPDLPKQPMTTVPGLAPPPIPVPQGITSPPSTPPPPDPGAPTTLIGLAGTPVELAEVPAIASRDSLPASSAAEGGRGSIETPTPRAGSEPGIAGSEPAPMLVVLSDQAPLSIPIATARGPTPSSPIPVVPPEPPPPPSSELVWIGDFANHAAAMATPQPASPAAPKEAPTDASAPLFDAIHDTAAPEEPRSDFQSEVMPRIMLEKLAEPTLDSAGLSPFEAKTVQRLGDTIPPEAVPSRSDTAPTAPLPFPTPPPPDSPYAQQSAASSTGVAVRPSPPGVAVRRPSSSATPSTRGAASSERAKATVGVRRSNNPPWLWAIAGVLAMVALGLGGWLVYNRYGRATEATAGARSGSGRTRIIAVGPTDAGKTAPPADTGVGSAPSSDATAAVPPDTGSALVTNELTIISDPVGAQVFLDGSSVGVTPVKLPGTPDRHTIGLLLAGHELYVAQVDGHGAFSIPLKEVTPSGGPAGIKVRCVTKERFYVFVDGKPTGQTCPTERIETELGPHTVEVYDLVSETRRKWDITIKDTRLSYRVNVDKGRPDKDR